MSRITAIDPASAQGKSKEILDQIKGALGSVPNLFRTAAHSPASLQALWGIFGAMGQSHLPAKIREQIALAVGQSNGCDYCVSAHTALGKGAGLSDSDLIAARRGQSADAKSAAAIKFSLAIVERKGHVSDADLAAVKGAGFGDAEILEILTVTVQNIFTNYLNHVAQTAIDFPAAPKLA